MNVFYIEKEKFLCLMFELVLKGEKHKIFTTDELDCHYLIKDQNPDLILFSMDFNEDNLALLLDEIRTDEQTMTIPVMAVGFPDQLNVLRERDKFDDFLEKPINPMNLEKKLKSYLEK